MSARDITDHASAVTDRLASIDRCTRLSEPGDAINDMGRRHDSAGCLYLEPGDRSGHFHRSRLGRRALLLTLYGPRDLHRVLLRDVLGGVALCGARHRTARAPGRLDRRRQTAISAGAYLGCTPGSPPGVPGGGMTLS